jgi:hypothetical protein
MHRFTNLVGLGLGLALGSGLIYGFFTSETLRLLAIGLGAFLLASITIGGTALLVNRQWTHALGTFRSTHNHRYHLETRLPTIWDSSSAWAARSEPLDSVLPRPDTLPMWPVGGLVQPGEEDEIVA